ncbi:hypothetical protein EG329_004585 [Mollisiaceae sp. DMI_Dod_QoI]|nr:hypothetical protein EG329_004585 [Helotiales sp. DMI_Dod_QoI]
MPQSGPSHPDVNDPNVFVFYRYDPSVAAAMTAVICFSATTASHIFQASRYRTYSFIPLIIGGFFDIIGYIARALAHNNQYSLSIYIMQQLMLLLAPALFAASIYMTLGRIIRFTDGEKLAPIPARWLTKIFVCGDVLSFMVQSGGAGIMANAKTMTFGGHLVVVGLLIQIISFGIFVVTGGLFHHRMARSPTPASLHAKWQKYMFTLYAASILIFLRSIFRVVEFSGGNDGFLMRREVFLYIFEGLFILGVMVAFNIVHPGEIIGRKSRDEAMTMTERESDSSEELK